MKNVVLSLALILCSFVDVVAQCQKTDWRPPLGGASGTQVKTTSSGARYVSRGFDQPRTKELAKSFDYLIKRGVNDGTLRQFLDASFGVTGVANDQKQLKKAIGWLRNHNVPEDKIQMFLEAHENGPPQSLIPQWIEEGRQEVIQKWVGCGGRFADVARSFKASEIYIWLEPIPVEWKKASSGPCLYASGYYSYNERRIRMVPVAISKLFDNVPNNEEVVTFRNLVAWEIGHIPTQKYGHQIKNPPHDEIGNQVPCEVLRRLNQL